MTRTIEASRAAPTGLECNECHRLETDPDGGIGAIMARGEWAQSLSSQQRHLCGDCYRTIEPLAREGYWRRHPPGANRDPSPSPVVTRAKIISVFVCDDSPAERFLMGQLIKERRNLYLAGAASSAVGAVQAIEAAKPDVVLLDHLDHDGDLSIIVRAIREAAPGVKLLIRSGLPATQIVGVSSADGYVAKAHDPEPLWQAIDEAAQRQ
jgi:CheY-like chemotaxis protein